MKIIYSYNNKSEDITELYSSATWSGNEEEVARRLELQVLNPLQDYYIPKVDLQLGGFIISYNDKEKELFQGLILSKEKSSQNSNISLVCVDALYYANKSKAIHNFNKKTAEEITTTLCNEAKIVIGALAVTGIAQDLPANNTVFNLIKDAYDYAGSLNGKYYIISMRQGKIYVEEKAKSANFVILASDSNISDSTYKETLESMVNIVKIYDDTGKQIGEVKNNGNIKAYGVFQETYEEETDKNYNMVANNMLKGVEKTFSIEATGNDECISGTYVTFNDKLTGISGDYTIISDNHTFSEGTHIMRLELREGY